MESNVVGKAHNSIEVEKEDSSALSKEQKSKYRNQAFWTYVSYGLTLTLMAGGVVEAINIAFKSTTFFYPAAIAVILVKTMVELVQDARYELRLVMERVERREKKNLAYSGQGPQKD